MTEVQSVAGSGIKPAAASRAESISISYCGDPYTSYSLNNMKAGNRVVQLVEIPAQTAKVLAGTELTAVNITNPGDTNTGRNTLTNVNVLIYTDLNAEPVVSQEAELGVNGFQYSKIELETPYVITGDTPVYFGYEFTYAAAYSSLGYIIVDSGEFPAYNSYIGIGTAGASVQFQNAANDMGLTQNLCITADASTDAELADCANIVALSADAAGEAGKEFYVEASVLGFSIEPITSLDICYTINGVEKTVTCKLDAPLEFLETDYIPFYAVTDTTGIAVEMSAKVVGVNGKPNLMDPNATESTVIDILPQGNGVQRMIVVEEATGTWCGYCPLGYLLMEDLRKMYDNYIGIAVHDGDSMTATSYADFIENYISGYPQCVLNRLTNVPLYNQTTQTLRVYEILHNLVSSWPAIAAIDFEATVNEELGTMDLTSTTTFGVSGSGDYRLAVVLKEDGVGPYRQTNNYYGTQGFGIFTTTMRPSLMYNDVAREIMDWDGIEGSLPATIEEGTAYEYKASISTSSITGNECDVVVMLING
ncbi:MAG: Omp28-related outer membrane protein, partial [Muribaculaceae bacterium]|nr:Omp28-related outer membrane protein [Muribaculaceae bacterium]